MTASVLKFPVMVIILCAVHVCVQHSRPCTHAVHAHKPVIAKVVLGMYTCRFPSNMRKSSRHGAHEYLRVIGLEQAKSRRVALSFGFCLESY